MRKYSGIHRRQLFHWIGRHIEESLAKGKFLSNEHRRNYLDCLGEVLEKGIRVRKPQHPDGLLDRSVIRTELPMACFTEWSVSDSFHHTLHYGRLGLGFPRQFILNRGGRPVTYLPATTKDPATNSILHVARYLNKCADPTVRKHWLAVSQFLKPMRPTPPRGQPKSPTDLGVPKRSKGEKLLALPKKRSFGGVMPFLEEREWRIVSSDRRKCFIPDEAGGEECFHLPIHAGEDLYTLVLPDYQTHAMLIESKDLMSRLISPAKPPVTILTLDDIDTF